MQIHPQPLIFKSWSISPWLPLVGATKYSHSIPRWRWIYCSVLVDFVCVLILGWPWPSTGCCNVESNSKPSKTNSFYVPLTGFVIMDFKPANPMYLRNYLSSILRWRNESDTSDQLVSSLAYLPLLSVVAVLSAVTSLGKLPHWSDTIPSIRLCVFSLTWSFYTSGS